MSRISFFSHEFRDIYDYKLYALLTFQLLENLKTNFNDSFKQVSALKNQKDDNEYYPIILCILSNTESLDYISKILKVLINEEEKTFSLFAGNKKVYI